MLSRRDDAEILKEIRKWMRQVMEEKGWRPSDWARLAGTSATNITRVLSPGSTIVPRANTLSRLAEAAGSQPVLIDPEQPGKEPAVYLPYLRVEEIKEIASEKFWQILMASKHNDTIQIDKPVGGPAFVVEVQDNSMEGRGLLQGDRALVEKCTTPLIGGDIVLVMIEGEPRVMEVQFPLLLFRPPPTQINETKYRPRMQDEAPVIGIVTRLIRDL